MKHLHRALALGVAVATATAVLAGPTPGPAAASPSHHSTTTHSRHPSGPATDVVSGRLAPGTATKARRGHFDNHGHVGDVVSWPASTTDEDGNTSFYLKDFRLAGIGRHLEVWLPVGDEVSTGLDFPADSPGACFNGKMTRVTRAQVSYLVRQFERVIRPRVGEVFGSPSRRNGRHATIPGVPAGAYRGPGHRVVLLVDNFRDHLFRTGQMGEVGEVGFVSSVQEKATDRNIVNLRGLAWAWGLGAHPEPDVVSDDPCEYRSSRPHFWEASLAHEYEHVIQGSVGSDFDLFTHDPQWITEGLAAWATDLTGYVDFRKNDRRNLQVSCFLGVLYEQSPVPGFRCAAGPTASLSHFGGIGINPMAGYGVAATFMSFLDGRYGHRFLGDLQSTTGVWGTEKVDALLRRRHVDADFTDLIGDWAAMLAVDGVIDDGARMVNGDADRYQTDGLRSSVAWDSPFAMLTRTSQDPDEFTSLGVAPDGSTYTRFRRGSGQWLKAGALRSLDFDGDTTTDCPFTVDADGHGTGDAALYSGTANGQNRAIGADVDVPADDPTLEFDLKYDTEQGWDFGYVQVSTDGGRTFHSLPTADTTSDIDPLSDVPGIRADLPGFTGSSGGWRHESADLSAYAGQHVVVAFRYRTDELVTGQGMWVDNVRLGGALLTDGSDLTTFHNMSPHVFRLLLRLVSYTDDHRVAAVANVRLDDENDAHLTAAQLARKVAPGAQTVAAVVTYVQPDVYLFCRTRYQLTVNDVVQPGG